MSGLTIDSGGLIAFDRNDPSGRGDLCSCGAAGAAIGRACWRGRTGVARRQAAGSARALARLGSGRDRNTRRRAGPRGRPALRCNAYTRRCRRLRSVVRPRARTCGAHLGSGRPAPARSLVEGRSGLTGTVGYGVASRFKSLELRCFPHTAGRRSPARGTDSPEVKPRPRNKKLSDVGYLAATLGTRFHFWTTVGPRLSACALR